MHQTRSGHKGIDRHSLPFVIRQGLFIHPAFRHRPPFSPRAPNSHSQGDVMRKTLIGITLSLLACGAAAAVIATTASAQPQAPRPPMEMTQGTATPDSPDMLLAQAQPPGRGAARGPARGAGRGAPSPARAADRRAQMCQDVYARAAGRLAYLEA